jgi:hypothetical protein
MQPAHTPGPDSGPSPTPSDESKPKTLSPQERRTIFVHMVRMELDQGSLAHRRRRQLIRFAQDMGIDKLEADLMIAQTLRNFGGQSSTTGPSGTSLELLGRPQCWPTWMKLSLAVGAGLFLNLLLIRYWLA